MPHIVEAFAHETFHGVHGALGLGEKTALRLATDVDRPIGRRRHNRRHETVAALVADYDRLATLDECHKAIRRSEINSNDFAHGEISSRSIPARRLLM